MALIHQLKTIRRLRFFNFLYYAFTYLINSTPVHLFPLYVLLVKPFLFFFFVFLSLDYFMRIQSKPPAKDFRRMMLNPGGSSQLSIVKTKRYCRRRLKLQSLNYTCQTKNDESNNNKEMFHHDEITVSLSPSSLSSGENGVVLSSFGAETEEGKYGVVSVIGRRSEMEDAVRAELGFAEVKGGKKKFDFFGVYDGHGGAHVAGTCRERLHEVVAKELENDDGFKSWEKVMEGCFGKMDEEVRSNAAARTVGTTAVVAIVAEDEVVVANCGDSRAVMSRDGGALALSIDHKVN